MPIMPTCKQVAALLIAKEDRPVALGDQVRVRLHLMACRTCPLFERQLLTMRHAMRQWRNYAAEEPPTPKT